jgi:LAS superfamily LD-carboxypeptidase LdcB
MNKKLIRTMALGVIAIGILWSIKNIAVNLLNGTIWAESVKKVEDIPVSNVEKDVETDVKVDYLKDTTYTDKDGKVVVKNTDDILVLVNKERNLPSDYKPEDLVVPNVRFSFDEKIEKRHMREEAAKALEELFNHAEEDGIMLYAVSGYRSYKTQNMLFDNKVKKVGIEEANKLVAVPGQSEHQTGLAIDVSCKEANFSLEENFGQTLEGKWLKNNAHKFGFIIRYPKEYVSITGYSYEPWHIRYVGKEAATEIFEKDITLEEFLGAK